MITHVIPLDDSMEHERATTCECGPTVELIEGNMLIIHHAADWREALERRGIPTGKKWGVFVET